MKWYRGTIFPALLAISLFGSQACKKAVDVVKTDLGEAGYKLTSADWFRASRENDVAAMKKFAAAKFPADTRDAAGDSALHAAAAAGAKDSEKFLLDRGLPVDLRGAAGRTPLMAAVLAGQTEMVGWLLRQGADPKLKDEQGFKPLMLAVRDGKTGAVVELAPYDRADLDPALLLAALVGRADVIDALTNYGASVYARMEDGRTPLMVAAENGHGEAVKLLLDIGSSRFTTDPSGRTAAELATGAGHPDIAALLTRNPAPDDLSLDPPATIASAMDSYLDAAGEHRNTVETGKRNATVQIDGQTLSNRVNRTSSPGKAVGDPAPSAGGDPFPMPPLVMRAYREKELPVSIRTVSGDTATIRIGGASNHDIKVKAGDRIPGSKLVVSRVQRRMENSKVSLGEPIEISVVAVRDTASGKTREWISGIPASAHDPVALVEDSATGRRYVVTPGQHFEDAEGHKYLVSEVRPNQVIVQDVASGDVRTIRLRGPRG